jgi:hypothetical protein
MAESASRGRMLNPAASSAARTSAVRFSALPALRPGERAAQMMSAAWGMISVLRRRRRRAS